MDNQIELIKNRDWKTLILLDACRFDDFQELNKLPGELRAVNSHSSQTVEWYRHNWSQPANDVVVISAHPTIQRFGFSKNFHDSIDCWNARMDESLVRKTLKTALDYDIGNKHLFIHLIPPHLPFVGPKGQQFLKKFGIGGGDPEIHLKLAAYGRKNGWQELRGYYREGLSCVLTWLEDYIYDLPFPLVITADHGEKIGEENKYHHDTPHPVLYTVPWFELSDEAILDNRLRKLGYM
jgi:hypothetical protein